MTYLLHHENGIWLTGVVMLVQERWNVSLLPKNTTCLISMYLVMKPVSRRIARHFWTINNRRAGSNGNTRTGVGCSRGKRDDGNRNHNNMTDDGNNLNPNDKDYKRKKWATMGLSMLNVVLIFNCRKCGCMPLTTTTSILSMLSINQDIP